MATTVKSGNDRLRNGKLLRRQSCIKCEACERNKSETNGEKVIKTNINKPAQFLVLAAVDLRAVLRVQVVSQRLLSVIPLLQL